MIDYIIISVQNTIDRIYNIDKNINKIQLNNRVKFRPFIR